MICHVPHREQFTEGDNSMFISPESAGHSFGSSLSKDVTGHFKTSHLWADQNQPVVA